MAIDLEDIGSRYTTTATASFRRAPLGGLGVAASGYMTYAQLDAFDKAWQSAANKLAVLKIPDSTRVILEELSTAYEDWYDKNKIGSVPKTGGTTVTGAVDQQAALAKLNTLYAVAVASGVPSDPEAASLLVKTGSGKTTALSPRYVSGNTGWAILAIGIGLAIVTWQPRRRSGGAMAGLDGVWSISKHPHLKRGPSYTVYHEPTGLRASKERLTHKQAKELMRALEERFPNIDPSDQSEVRKVAAFIGEKR